MDNFSIYIKPQYVRQTNEKEVINGRACLLHEVQKRIKLDFDRLPEFTLITAPTGTGKSYAFPFPAINAKKQRKGIGSSRNVRGLIVLPTNALINELTGSFRETYRQLVINQLTGPELNRHEVTGYRRWKKAIDLAESSDLVITNPDIINFAMHGGYHRYAWDNKTGDTTFSRFLSTFNYVIFDEYHLYDEAQIANILTLIKLREFFLKHHGAEKGSVHGVRFLFVSATPEEGLKKIFEEENMAYEEIIEAIVDDSSHARPIHGRIAVEFVDSKDMSSLVMEKIPELREVLAVHKALLILDQLRDVQILAEKLREVFPEYTIYQSTGYVSSNEPQEAKIKAAHLIIATNKAEVGVNYDVEYCIMQPGKYFQNFVQRFGRVSRGDLDGKVVICVDKKYRRFKNVFKSVNLISYYDFLEVMRAELQGRKFYTERVPMYLGEYMWCIENNIRRYQAYDVHRYLKRRMEEEAFHMGKYYQRYRLMKDINNKIREIIKKSLRLAQLPYSEKKLKKQGVYTTLEKMAPRSWQWAMWWNNYIDTFLTFRDGGKVVKIYDQKQGIELAYSLDWILQHKVVVDIQTEQTEPYEIVKYVVGDLKDRDKDLQYTVSTIPNAGMQGNNYLSYREIYQLGEVFEKAIERIYDKVRKGVEEQDRLQMELCKLVSSLSKSFDRKRLKIEAIENNDTFL